MNYLKKLGSHRIGLWLVLAVIVASVSTPVRAGEKGKWRGRAALVSTKLETVKVEDQAEHAIYFSEADGVVFNDSGEAFKEVTPPTDKGKWQFIGGTGKYQGIKGQGVYTYIEVSPTAGWDVLEGEYELP